MKLPPPSPKYTPIAEAARNRQIEQADDKNLKSDKMNILGAGASLVLQASDGTYHKLVVSPAGVLSTTPVTP